MLYNPIMLVTIKGNNAAINKFIVPTVASAAIKSEEKYMKN